MNNGWIKLHRRLLDNGIASKPSYAWLWTTLLLLANHEDKSFIWNKKKQICRVGQILTGRLALSKQTGIPSGTIEDILNFLESQQQIQQEKTTKFRLITIIKWNEFQVSDNKPDNRATTDRHKQECKNTKNTLSAIADEGKNKIKKPLGKNLYPLAIYILCRGTYMSSVEELKPIIARSSKISTQLSVYSLHDLVLAYLIAQKESQNGQKYEVTLETVGKKILAAKEKVETPEEKEKIGNLCEAFEKYKDVLFTKSSPLIRA